MKKSILFLLITIIFLCSCKKNNQRNNANLIIGKWYNQNLEEAYNLSSDPSRHTVYTFSKGEYIEFFDDGTLIDNGGDFAHSPYTPSNHPGTYSIVGSTLYITVNYPIESFYDTSQIQTLTDSKLTLYEAHPSRGGTEESWENFLK